MREEREREEREIFPDGWFSSNSLILFLGRKSTFEKREKKIQKKKYKSGERAARTMMPPALNGGKRCIFLRLFLSVR